MTKDNRLPKQIEYLDMLESGERIDQATLEKIKSEDPDLYELLYISNQLRNKKLVKPNPLFITSSKLRIYHQVFAAEEEKVTLVDRLTGWFSQLGVPKLSYSPALTVILVLVLCFSLFVGGAQAADNSRPGDFLYPADQALESAQLIFTVNDSARLRLLLSFADERLEEAEAGFAAGDFDNALAALGGFERETASIFSLLENDQIEFSDELMQQANTSMRKNINVLTILYESIGPDGMPEQAEKGLLTAINAASKHLENQPTELLESTKTPPGLEGKDTPPGLEEKDVPPGQEQKENQTQKTPPGLEKKQDQNQKTPPGLENKEDKGQD